MIDLATVLDPTGWWLQPYRAKISNWAAVPARLAELKAAGCRGVAWHGFTTELPDHLPGLVKLCADAGLGAAAAFGLDSDDPTGKGARMARAARVPGCAFVVTDLEGKGEDEAAAAEDAHERAEAAAFRAAAPPGTVVLGQAWELPTFHWSHYPWEAQAAFVDGQVPMWYPNNYRKQYGDKRYAAMWPRYEAAWHRLEARLAARDPGLVKPRGFTTQGSAWVLSDNVDVLLRDTPKLVWAEPWPDPTFLTAAKASVALRARGFHGAGAVAAFKTAAHLPADPVVDRAVLRALGVV